MTGHTDRLQEALGDRYRLVRELGRGGMAVVFLAEDARHGRHVAIKVLHAEVAEAVGAERFLREIEIAARLSHPHVLPLHDSGEAGGFLYYVMPWVEGESLRDRLDRERQLPVEDAVRIARQVADALGHAHALGVVHRDVKPENILLQAGHAVVSDFGIARAVGAAGGERLTRTGLVMGTPLYMPLEQAMGSGEQDPRTDVYALGCVLWEMLAGEPPHGAATAQAVLARKALDTLPPLLALRETVPPALEEVVARALARLPADRFSSAAEMVRALDGVAVGSTAARSATEGAGDPEAPLVRLLAEVHRRSLWQVLALYAVTSWVALQVVGSLTRTAGLPGWVPPSALVLLLVGLPIVLATALVQGGGPGRREGRRERPTGGATRPSFLRRHLTWRRATLGGVGAFAVLGLLAAGYLASWATGIGPVGSLVAQGALEEGERIVLADFGETLADPGMGVMVTEALRVDLLETPILRVLEHAEVREVLQRMGPTSDGRLPPERAREVALRAGVKAVLEGEVAGAGAGWVLTATLRSAETGRSLAAFRESARGPDELIAAIDRLSRRIRERAGESLRSIHAAPRLEQVTTASLEALRLYGEAMRAFNEGGDYRRAIALLDEVLQQDPEFAMAWRALSVILGNLEQDRVREVEAATRAYELRHRLSERERHLTTAFFSHRVTRDKAATIDAYQRVLQIAPDDRAALTNLAVQYMDSEEYEAAAELLERAVAGPAPSAVTFQNLLLSRIGMGRVNDALAVADSLQARIPENLNISLNRYWALLLQGDEAGARRAVEPDLSRPGLSPVVRARAHDLMARLALHRGRMAEAREHLAAAERLAEQVGGSFFLVRRLWAAHAEVVAGNPDRGVRLLLEATEGGRLEDLPPADRWHFFRALVVGMAGRADQVEAVLREFDEEVPLEFHDSFHVRNESARALIPLQRGDPEEAIRILERIRSQRSCRACYADRMGWALLEAGRLGEAAEEWEMALTWRDLTHDPGWHFAQNLWVLQRLPAVYEELGDTARALTHYRRLAELWEDADPELQPRVRHARERITALEPGP